MFHAFQFDGSSGYASAPVQNYSSGGYQAFGCWARLDATPSSDAWAIGICVPDGIPRTNQIALFVTTSRKVRGYFDSNYVESSGTMTVGQWHWIMTANNAAGWGVWLDGEYDSGGAGSGPQSTFLNRFSIGADLYPSAQSFFPGAIALPSMWAVTPPMERLDGYRIFKGRMPWDHRPNGLVMSYRIRGDTNWPISYRQTNFSDTGSMIMTRSGGAKLIPAQLPVWGRPGRAAVAKKFSSPLPPANTHGWDGPFTGLIPPVTLGPLTEQRKKIYR